MCAVGRNVKIHYKNLGRSVLIFYEGLDLSHVVHPVLGVGQKRERRGRDGKIAKITRLRLMPVQIVGWSSNFN